LIIVYGVIVSRFCFRFRKGEKKKEREIVTRGKRRKKRIKRERGRNMLERIWNYNLRQVNSTIVNLKKNIGKRINMVRKGSIVTRNTSGTIRARVIMI
jgi:hypothetical protein